MIDTNLLYCVDCRYCVAVLGTAMCKHKQAMMQNLWGLIATKSTCVSMRKSTLLCGLGGNYFEKNK